MPCACFFQLLPSYLQAGMIGMTSAKLENDMQHPLSTNEVWPH